MCRGRLNGQDFRIYWMLSCWKLASPGLSPCGPPDFTFHSPCSPPDFTFHALRGPPRFHISRPLRPPPHVSHFTRPPPHVYFTPDAAFSVQKSASSPQTQNPGLVCHEGVAEAGKDRGKDLKARKGPGVSGRGEGDAGRSRATGGNGSQPLRTFSQKSFCNESAP